MSRGRLFVVSGASGSGKGTVLSALKEKNEKIFFSVSATTRAPRPGETDGIDYHFKSRDEFESMISRNELLEYAQYAGNYYGTPIAPVVEHMDKGDNVILEIEVQGFRQIKKKLPEAVTVFIAPPSFDELERRLRLRGTESEDKILMRLKAAREELAAADEYDYTVINDDLNTAVNELYGIIFGI